MLRHQQQKIHTYIHRKCAIEVSLNKEKRLNNVHQTQKRTVRDQR